VRGTHRRPGGRAPRCAAIAAAVAIGLVATACSSVSHSTVSGTSPAQSRAEASASAKARAAELAKARAAALARDLKITPADGRHDASPSDGITVTAVGRVKHVSVRTSGDAVYGSLAADGKSWHSTGHLGISQSYTVIATGTAPSGEKVTETSTFRTLTPAQTFSTEIFEGYQQTYGVGMPIMLTFSQPVTNKAAVERSFELTTSKPVIGAWYWDGDQHLYFRPRDYWPAYTEVTLTSHLDGIEGATGVYGARDLSQTFEIGRSLIAVASTTAHKTLVYLNGKLTYQWPISTGRPSEPTPDGTYLSIEKANPVRMIGGGPKGSPGYYNELVNFAVRFTWSGDYYHSAPWSVVDQGSTNVSHGCVNLPPTGAKIYYNLSIPGDPITITASTAGGKWDDGWTPWFLPWSQYLNGSATGEAVEAGPQGSTFVSPSSLAASTASAPVGTPATGNSGAGTVSLG
jgi:lipoprotein-anchoring transpeptidase ErfK/SrfK